MQDHGPAPRLIRRYDNRKLYDVAERRYITLDDLGRLVARGLEVEVKDQKSGGDLTSLTLAQILLEGLRQRTARIPRPLLVQLVRLAAGPAHTSWPSAQEAARRAGAEAEKIAAGLLTRGRLTLEEAFSLRQEIVKSWGALVAEAQAGIDAGLHRLMGAEQPKPRGGTAAPTRRRRAKAPAPTPRNRNRKGTR
ncbi:MAG TPA: polyhydroxyalkanoate synthesis regulator DNA-binding domain-containing protein [Vicinamibacteria bacterium]